VPCLFVLFAAFAPRLMLVFFWIARPTIMSTVFDTFLLPLLGFVFLPFTTLMYVLLYLGSTPNGISGADWLWLGLAVVLDLANHSGAFTQRGAVPGMSSAGAASAAAAPITSPPAAAPAAAVTPPSDEAPPSA